MISIKCSAYQRNKALLAVVLATLVTRVFKYIKKDWKKKKTTNARTLYEDNNRVYWMTPFEMGLDGSLSSVAIHMVSLVPSMFARWRATLR